MSCIRFTKTNEAESILFNDLFKIVKDENEAGALYSYFREPIFLNEIFGDYETFYNTKNKKQKDIKSFEDRIDENGEPKIFYNKKLNKHYYLDKFHEPVFYPHSEQGIGSVFDTNDIKKFSKTIASAFYKQNIEFDYNTLEFTKKSSTLLRDFIKDFIDKKASELQNNDNPDMLMKGIALEQSSIYINEWLNEVKDYFSSLKINYEVEENTSIEEEGAVLGEEMSADDLMRRESFLKSGKNNVSNNIKLFLSFIPSDSLNDFNEFDFISYDDIYTTLNKSLSNQIALDNEDIYDIYTDIIKDLTNVKPYFNELHGELTKDNISEDFKNQFSSTFNLYKNNFLGSESSINEEGERNYTVRNLSEVGSRKNSIISQWYFNFKQKQLSEVNVKDIDNSINSDLDAFIQSIRTINKEEDLIPYLNKLMTHLNNIGVEYTEKGFDYYLNGLEFNDLSLEDKIKNIRKTFKNISYALNYYSDTQENLFLNQSIFKDLAEAEAFFMKEGSDASIFSIGKTKWVYSLPSYIDLKVQKWKKNPDLLIKHYLSTPYNRGSLWLKYFAENPSAIKDIEVGIFNSVQVQGDSLNASDNKSLSYTDSLNDYIHKLLASRKGGKVYHKTALAADKATEYQIFFGDNEIFNLYGNTRTEDKKTTLDDRIVDIFYNYFKSEYERMAYEHSVIEKGENLLPNYHLGNKNALQSQLFPSLSVTFKDGIAIIPNLPVTLYDKNGKPIYEDLDAVKEHILPLIKQSIVKGIESTYNELFENDIFILDIEGNRINNTLDNSIYEYYVNKSGINNREHGKSNAPLRIAGDIFINSTISQVEYSKMFTGDVAYYKNITDYKKRVPSTYTDGLYMRLGKGEQHFNVSIIASVKIKAQDLDKMTYLSDDIKEKYLNINSTDAQAWITPQRWKFIMKRLGKWDAKKTSIYEKMFEETPTFTNEELKLVAQPLKGVYFDVNEKGVPTFLKYSQAVLVPNLIKGTGLERLYNKMNESQMDELITQDGIKVGSPIPSVTHDKNGDVLFDFTLNKIKLNNTSWKLQQDLPTKGIKSTDVGSQIQKNIFQGLAFNLKETFELGNEEINGSELIDYINDVVNALSEKGKQSILSRFSLDSQTLKVKDESILYKSLIDQLKARKDVPNNFIKALEAGISPYGIPGAFQMFQNVFSSIINKELVKIQTNGGGFIQMADYGLSKQEAKQKNMIFTPWFDENKLGTYRKLDNDRKSLNPAGIFLSGSFIAKHIPNYKSLSSEKLFGVLNEETGKYEGGKIDQEILQNIIGYRIPNQGLPSNDALQVMGILPEEMGDTIIAYTGITTKTGSDFDIDKMYLMIPSFNAEYKNSDIQKAKNYIKDRKFSFNTLRDEVSSIGYEVESLDRNEIYEIFIDEILFTDHDMHNQYYKDFHNEYQDKGKELIADKLTYVKLAKDEDGKNLPLYQQSKKALQNRLIETYKSVLTNEKVIGDVMNPIDLPYIENDIKNLFPEEKLGDLESFSAIKDLTLKDEFKLGKAGLGQNVNSLVDSVRGSMGNLYLDTYLGWGNNNNSGTKFDNEYSEELSTKEINDYLSSYNEGLAEDKRITKEDVKKLAKIKLNTSMMMLVNGFVDIAKDPYIVKGNWVTQTNNLGFLLLRAGAHPFKVNAFLAQPILKEFVKFRTNQESQSINETSRITERFKLKKAAENIVNEKVTINAVSLNKRNLFTKLLNPNQVRKIIDDNTKLNVFDNITSDVIEKFGTTREELDTKPNMLNEINSLKQEFIDAYESVFEVQPKPFNQITLKELRDEIKVNSNIEIQLSVMEMFDIWMDKAKLLAANVSASKIDVDGKGKNINSLIVAVNKIHNILDKEDKEDKEGSLKGFKTKLYRNGKSTLLNSAVKALTFSYDVMKANPKYFFSANDTTISTFNVISDYLYGQRLQNDELADKLEKSYYSYVMSGFKPLSLSTEQKSSLINDLPLELNNLKRELPDNTLIQELFIKDSPDETSFISMPNVKKSVSYENELVDSWKDLLESHPKFAENLIKYSFLISGFNNSINQFHKFIPYEWFNKNRFNSYLKEITFDYNNFLDRNFIDQFFRNNYEDESLISRAFRSEMLPLGSGDGYGTGYVAANFKNTDRIPFMTKYHIPQDEGKDIIRYYKLAGLNNEGTPVYLRTSLLGYKDYRGNKVVEYSLGHTNTANYLSMFKDNKVTRGTMNSELYLSIKNSESISEAYNPDMIVGKYDNVITKDDSIIEKVINESQEILDNSKNINTFEENNNMREYTPENITFLKENEIFVFGSNTEGRHGKGAALVAKNKFGAKQGQSKGLQGQSYAIITKDLSKGEKSISLDEIGEQFADLFEYANNTPKKKFYVTKLGSALAGYTIEEIKTQIQQVNDVNAGNFIGDNIVLPIEYEVRDINDTTNNQLGFDFKC